jgi:hypothetical protein
MELRAKLARLPIAAYQAGPHTASCAIYDPTPDPCDCGAAQHEPLYRRSDVLALIDAASGVREDALRLAGAAGLLPDPDIAGVLGTPNDQQEQPR